MNLICYPPAPYDGGRLEFAPEKIGEWIWQPKVDDRRVVIHVPSQTIWNNEGKLSIGNTQKHKFQVALDELKRIWEEHANVGGYMSEWIDAGLMEYRHDMMRGCIIVFDLIVGQYTFQERRRILEKMLTILRPDISTLLKGNFTIEDEAFLIHQWVVDDPLELKKFLQEENEKIGKKFYEGLVAKKLNSLYHFGLSFKDKTTDWIKHRFDQR